MAFQITPWHILACKMKKNKHGYMFVLSKTLSAFRKNIPLINKRMENIGSLRSSLRGKRGFDVQKGKKKRKMKYYKCSFLRSFCLLLLRKMREFV